MIDALAIYILNTYPGLVCLFRSFQPITLSLMFGRGFPHLSERDSKALLDLLSKPDLRIQNYPNTWQELDAKTVSVSAASDLMRVQKNSQAEAEAAGKFDAMQSDVEEHPWQARANQSFHES